MQIPAGKQAVILLDRAGWHTTKHLNHFKNIILLALLAACRGLKSNGTKTYAKGNLSVQLGKKSNGPFIGSKGLYLDLKTKATKLKKALVAQL